MADNTGTDEAALEQAATIAEQFEGYSAVPYRCPAGVWTIGYGSTRVKGLPVTASTPSVTKATAHALMINDLCSALLGLRRGTSVPLTVGEEAALLDFIYNVGTGNFLASTLLQKLNRGDHLGAAAEFVKWNKGGGVVLAGLVRRRAAEREAFLTPRTV